jgi:hypothetical protein
LTLPLLLLMRLEARRRATPLLRFFAFMPFVGAGVDVAQKHRARTGRS